MGKHLKFYKNCLNIGKLPIGFCNTTAFGLCECAHKGYIDYDLLCIMRPLESKSVYWGGRLGALTPLRQTIVLFMAAMNNEL